MVNQEAISAYINKLQEVKRGEDCEALVRAYPTLLSETTCLGENILMKTIQCRSHETLDLLTKSKHWTALVTSADLRGYTPLHYAADSGQVLIGKILLMNNADVNALSDSGATPLFNAVGKNRVEMVALLLTDKNIKVNISRGPEDETALSFAMAIRVKADKHFAEYREAENDAAVLANIKIINMLIERHDLDSAELPYMLHITVEQGWDDTLEIILKKDNAKSLVNSRNAGQCKPLHFAANKGYAAVVALLVEKDDDIDAGSKPGCTALSLAASRGYCNVVDILLRANANVNLKTEYDRTALAWAVRAKKKSMVSLLLRVPGIDISETYDGLTLKEVAQEHDWANIVEMVDKIEQQCVKAKQANPEAHSTTKHTRKI